MTIEQAKPRPMSEAPRDGTVILVFVSGVRHGQPAYFGPRRGSAKSMHAWRYTSNDEVATASLFLGWLPCPTYTGEAVK